MLGFLEEGSRYVLWSFFLICKRFFVRDIVISILYKWGRVNGVKMYYIVCSSVLGLFSCGIYNGWDVGGVV